MLEISCNSTVFKYKIGETSKNLLNLAEVANFKVSIKLRRLKLSIPGISNSRFGLGFQLGDHADVQVQYDVGPQLNRFGE